MQNYYYEINIYFKGDGNLVCVNTNIYKLSQYIKYYIINIFTHTHHALAQPQLLDAGIAR